MNSQEEIFQRIEKLEGQISNQGVFRRLFNKTSVLWGSLIVAILFGGLLTAAVTLPHAFSSGTTISSSEVNANFNALRDQINLNSSNITNNSNNFNARSGWQTVQAQNVTAATTLNFTNLQPGTKYHLDFKLQWNTAAGFLQGTFNGDTSASYAWLRTSGNNAGGTGAGGQAAGTNFAVFSGAGATVAAGTYVTGNFTFETAPGSSAITLYNGLAHSSYIMTSVNGGRYFGTINLTSINLTASAGDFTGRFLLSKYVP